MKNEIQPIKVLQCYHYTLVSDRICIKLCVTTYNIFEIIFIKYHLSLLNIYIF